MGILCCRIPGFSSPRPPRPHGEITPLTWKKRKWQRHFHLFQRGDPAKEPADTGCCQISVKTPNATHSCQVFQTHPVSSTLKPCLIFFWLSIPQESIYPTSPNPLAKSKSEAISCQLRRPELSFIHLRWGLLSIFYRLFPNCPYCLRLVHPGGPRCLYSDS